VKKNPVLAEKNRLGILTGGTGKTMTRPSFSEQDWDANAGVKTPGGAERFQSSSTKIAPATTDRGEMIVLRMEQKGAYHRRKKRKGTCTPSKETARL